jgi:uncharacterized membrane protein YjjP (DUF1212 family)
MKKWIFGIGGGLIAIILSIIGVKGLKGRKARKKISRAQQQMQEQTLKRLEEITLACERQDMDAKEAAEKLEQLKKELMDEAGITDPDPRDYDLAIDED